MSNWPPDWLHDSPPPVREALDAGVRGTLAAPIVLTRLFLFMGDEAKIASLLLRSETALRVAANNEAAARIRAVFDLTQRGTADFANMRQVLALLHGGTCGRHAADAPSLAGAFDKAAEISPAASVALYTLGDDALLEQATQEVVSFLRSRGLTARASRVLEIGCGIGRFARALAGEVRSFVGLDISNNMIAIAQERCAGLSNVTFSITSGNDLRNHADESFDLVLAVDSFPYIVAAGGDLADRHVRESARVLSPGGDLAIFNFSYQDDFAQSRATLLRLGEGARLRFLAAEPAALRSWDGSFFHLRKQG
jgi:predicted TPR repeat methyltransferase